MQPPRFDFCQYFGFVFLQFCARNPSSPYTNPINQNYVQQNYIQRSVANTFTPEYDWSVVNFTWPTRASYEEALQTGDYIPANNVLAGFKFYKHRLYFALPRIRRGTPVTMASIAISPDRSLEDFPRKDILLEPFPSWSNNVKRNCCTLQNVQSMEIDRRGIMWVLDGNRNNNFSKCPPKLILYDLNKNNRIVSTYTFPTEIALTEGSLLNDLVIDESDGGYAYISDTSAIDPGLIVYSRKQRRSWKLRDRSMFPELDATNFTVDGTRFGALASINGIALSPVNPRPDEERIIYYAPLSGFNIFAISNKILRNENFCKTDNWRAYVKHVGRRSSIGDGMLIDNKGNLFYGLMQTNGIGKWNIYEYFSTARDIVNNSKDMSWPDSFAMDDDGYLYVMCNGMHKFMDLTNDVINDGSIKFKILRLYTGNKNYLYSP